MGKLVIESVYEAGYSILHEGGTEIEEQPEPRLPNSKSKTAS